MAYLSLGNPNCSVLCSNGTISYMGNSAFPLLHPKVASVGGFIRADHIPLHLYEKETSLFLRKHSSYTKFNKGHYTIPSCSGSSESRGSQDDSSVQAKAPFGYTRKDVILIGIGLTVFGIGLKSGLEFGGVDPLQAGNVVQLVLVLGLTVGWISTYIFRVSNKDMTYVQQLRDYEDKVMEKRLEGLTEAELEALLEQVEEEKRVKRRLASGEQIN
ncbi:hypothetical protein HS088_TW20G00670 [Tripterygium wilfordii]|uniref:Uncharacterized protein n=1 Tax=Tripterygium wilfordii TaxID=458696 RepID=A0A7J7C8W8_TRIWF|nr:uncharacterized protein LOC119986488 [Tripterygium wilfordii]KAF5730297.1 hypothetical protein HS088_TW20G00670 [Tripterygium wilfordii]